MRITEAPISFKIEEEEEEEAIPFMDELGNGMEMAEEEERRSEGDLGGGELRRVD